MVGLGIKPSSLVVKNNLRACQLNLTNVPQKGSQNLVYKNVFKLILFSRSVGVIAYVLLSGLSPFLGECDAETWANVTQADPLTFDDEPVSFVLDF